MGDLPLSGIRVLEMGSSVAGPFCCRILADLGAEVIKVEPPGSGDPARGWGAEQLGGTSAAFQVMNNGKRSIVVDFKNAADVARLKRLIEASVDVVIQNLRPGVADRLGLGPTGARALNPQLIYCNISAFGRDGPLSQLPGYDPLLQAFGGLINVTGPEDGAPARVGVPIIDMGTGMWTAIGALAALHTRARTGHGCIVDAAMFDTALAWQSLSAATIEAGGEAPKRSGLTGPLIVPNTAYRTADGLLLITVGTDKQFTKLCQVLGKPELADDARFVDNTARAAHERELAQELEAVFRQASRKNWSKSLDAVEVPNAPIQTLEEAMSHDQAEASGILKRAPDDAYRLVGNVLKFDGERPGFASAAPALGEANGDVLSTKT